MPVPGPARPARGEGAGWDDPIVLCDVFSTVFPLWGQPTPSTLKRSGVLALSAWPTQWMARMAPLVCFRAE
jgi:hypothetical protein